MAQLRQWFKYFDYDFQTIKKREDAEIEILSSLGVVANGDISTGQNGTRGLK